MYGVFSCPKCRDRIFTKWSGVILLENDTMICDTINIRRWNFWVTVEANIIPTLENNFERLTDLKVFPQNFPNSVVIVD